MKRLTEVDKMDLDSLLMCLENVEGVGKGVVSRWKKALRKVLDGQNKCFMLEPEMLQKGLPPVAYLGEGPNKSVNVVLALWSREIYDNSNQYIPRWCVSNAEYYRKHIKQFEGWIGLKNMDTTPLSRAEKRKAKK